MSFELAWPLADAVMTAVLYFNDGDVNSLYGCSTDSPDPGTGID
ncbi:hypothetical protein [Cytobacillus pseudoceanisediminis]